MLWYNNLQIPRYLLTTMVVDDDASVSAILPFDIAFDAPWSHLSPEARVVCLMGALFLLVVASCVYERLHDAFYPTPEKCFQQVWDGKSRCEIYKLLGDIQKVFAYTGVRQYACFGTLLGAMRHDDLIPWDDDVDIAYVDKDEDKLPRAFALLKERHNISCIVVREGLVGAPYYRLFRGTSEVIPFGQGRWPYVDLFRSNTVHNDDVSQAFIAPSGRRPFASKSLFPLRKKSFGPICVYTPNQPYAHLDAEFGKSHGPGGYMTTAVGTSFHHRTQLPSFCSTVSKHVPSKSQKQL